VINQHWQDRAAAQHVEPDIALVALRGRRHLVIRRQDCGRDDGLTSDCLSKA
jgi:hypothetical protein